MRILVMLDPTNKRGTKKHIPISVTFWSPTDTCELERSCICVSLQVERPPKSTSGDYPNTRPAPEPWAFSASQKNSMKASGI